MPSRNNRCFDTKHNRLKAFMGGSFLGIVIASVLFVKFCILPFKGEGFSFLFMYIGLPLLFLSALFCGLKLFLGAVNTRIVITEKEMNITIGKSTQSFDIMDFIGFLPVNEYEYLDSYKFLVFKHCSDNDSSEFILPGMTDEHYSYVLLQGVSNRQYRKMMAWLPAILKDLNMEKNKNDMVDCQPLSYERLLEEYSKSGNQKI